MTREKLRSDLASRVPIEVWKSTDATRYCWPSSILKVTNEAFFVGIVFGQRGHDLHVGIAVLEIEAANQVAVGLDAVGIIDVVAAEEAQQVGFARLDDVLQAIGGIGDVADELDRPDAGLAAFGDREDQVDAVVRLLDDFRGDANVIAARAPVDFGDPLGVRLHHGARQRPARLGLDFGRELVVLDLLVAFKGDAADDGIFDHDRRPAGRPAWLIRTSWNRPVSINAFRPSSICPCPRRPPGPGRK